MKCKKCNVKMLKYDDFNETFSHSEYDGTEPHHYYCPKCGRRVTVKKE